MLATVTNVVGAISWNPDIRNILSLAVGVGVLIGSVYLILATNTGIRTGLLVTLAGLFGWMTIMGVIWWMYGIGMLGEQAAWHAREINYTDPDYAGLEDATIDEAQGLSGLGDLPTAQEILEDRPDLVDAILPPELEGEEREARAANITLGQIVEVDPGIIEEYGFDEALEGWVLLGQSDRQRGDAVAAAQAFVGPDARALFESSDGYLVLDAYSIGGKDTLPEDPSRWDRIKLELESIFVEPLHPTHYAVVQVRKVIPECDEESGQVSTDENPCYTVEPGEAAPTPVVDETAPIVSVVLIRDLGDKRFPAFMITLVFGALFALTCWTLHRRDAVVVARRAAPA